MGKSKNNGTNFLVQGSILAVASIISRIIGLVYRIPLNNILGDVGISYYACAFDVYNVILIISSYSLPQAVSKTVSAKAAKGQYRSVYQVLKVHFFLPWYRELWHRLLYFSEQNFLPEHS